MRYLIFGGAGSLGTALTDRLLLEGHETSVASRDEYKHYQLLQRHPEVQTFLCDVRDRARVLQVLEEFRPDVVIHAAALKQVPMGNANPMEFIQTNCIGTFNVASACIVARVPKMILISSDKQTAPTVTYGATKMLAERIVASLAPLATQSGVKLSTVRYGNVSGSRGSVLGLFIKQADQGGPMTITHPDMTRFWITMPQAVQLVLDVINRIEGVGETWVPLLPAVRMTELAAAIGPGIKQEIIGLRGGGEKIHEELICVEEASYLYTGRTLESDCGEVVMLKTRTTSEAGGIYSGDRSTAPYTSRNPLRWLTKEEIEEVVAEYKSREEVPT